MNSRHQQYHNEITSGVNRILNYLEIVCKSIPTNYERYIDNISNDSLETITDLESIEKNFIRNCIKYIRKDKIEKINSL